VRLSSPHHHRHHHDHAAEEGHSTVLDEWPDAVANGVGNDADDNERDQERKRCDEQALPACLAQVFMIQFLEPSITHGGNNDPQRERQQYFKRPGIDIPHEK